MRAFTLKDTWHGGDGTRHRLPAHTEVWIAISRLPDGQLRWWLRGAEITHLSAEFREYITLGEIFFREDEITFSDPTNPEASQGKTNPVEVSGVPMTHHVERVE